MCKAVVGSRKRAVKNDFSCCTQSTFRTFLRDGVSEFFEPLPLCEKKGQTVTTLTPCLAKGRMYSNDDFVFQQSLFFLLSCTCPGPNAEEGLVPKLVFQFRLANLLEIRLKVQILNVLLTLFSQEDIKSSCDGLATIFLRALCGECPSRSLNCQTP